MFAPRYDRDDYAAFLAAAERPAMDDRSIRRVLSNVVAGLAKSADAPASAQTHFDSAIAELAKATDWRPDDAELRAIVDAAIEHMAFYR